MCGEGGGWRREKNGGAKKLTAGGFSLLFVIFLSETEKCVVRKIIYF